MKALKYQAVMFDLDGTLADTLQDIAEAGNHMLQQLGLTARPIDQYRYLAGQGLPYLVRHALGEEHADFFDRGIAEFRAYYTKHKYDHTGPFAGIPALLDAITESDMRMAVLSNKPDDATRAVMAELFSRWAFDAVRGHRENIPLKPDPAAALAIADELGIALAHWVYVGDTKVDMQTGKSAGMFTVGVTWGFRDETELRENGADAIVHTPEALMSLIGLPCVAGEK